MADDDLFLDREEIIRCLRAFSMEVYCNNPRAIEEAIRQAADWLAEYGKIENRWGEHYLKCHDWSEIEFAPVPPRETLKHQRWRCLLQDKRGWIELGWAAYARLPGQKERYRLQWYDGRGRVFMPVKWMPIPSAKV